MKTTAEERKIEAIKRMETLKLDSHCISAFKKGNVWTSETKFGALYEINDKEVTEKIKDFENEHNCTVYHCIHNLFEFGECYSFLYVSDYKDEWKSDNEDLKEGYPIVYVWNVDDDYCSEFGSIGIEPRFGGLVRTA